MEIKTQRQALIKLRNDQMETLMAKKASIRMLGLRNPEEVFSKKPEMDQETFQVKEKVVKVKDKIDSLEAESVDVEIGIEVIDKMIDESKEG